MLSQLAPLKLLIIVLQFNTQTYLPLKITFITVEVGRVGCTSNYGHVRNVAWRERNIFDK